MFSKSFAALLVPGLLATVEGTMVNKRSTGALTSLSEKSTICNVLDYGGVADDSTDIGPAISDAFTECASAGGATLYVPEGNYSLATGVTLSGGSAWAFQLDGLITLTSDGDFGGNAIVIEKGSDVELFSSNALGAINGQGYITRSTDSSQNARLVRFIDVSDVSIHDLILVDSPTFHLVLNDVSNAEVYHITIRGPDVGGTDGIDLICDDNCYLHDIEVTNRDECISVKSPSTNVLIEDVYCNHSGGMSIGSLTADIDDSDDAAAVSNITMRNIYNFQSVESLMIKTFPGGSGATGYVKDCLFENFWVYDTTYNLDIDQYWEETTSPDTGAVALSGLTFRNWTGTVDDGEERGPIVIRGSDIVPVTDITLEDFNFWDQNGGVLLNQCKNVYGTGYCAESNVEGLEATALATFTSTVTQAAATIAATPTSPAWGISGYGTTDPIPVYYPTVWWSPASAGVAATTSASSVASSSIAISSDVNVAVSSSYAATTPTPVASSSYIAPASSVVAVSSVDAVASSAVSSPPASSFVTSVVASAAPVAPSSVAPSIVPSAIPSFAAAPSGTVYPAGAPGGFSPQPSGSASQPGQQGGAQGGAPAGGNGFGGFGGQNAAAGNEDDTCEF